MAPQVPNFLVIGMAKSGTTALYTYLRSHPQVFLPLRKEPNFFCGKEVYGINERDQYLALFRNSAGYSAIGEASVYYLIDPEAPRRIYEFFGKNIKFVVLFRNPVDMVYSWWGQMCASGLEDLSFEGALAAEKIRLGNPRFAQTCRGWVSAYAYREKGRYDEHLQRYFEYFPRENFAIYIFEEFFKLGLPFWGDLCRFLGISDDVPVREKIVNAATNVHSISLSRSLAQWAAWQSPFRALLPDRARLLIGRALRALNEVEAPLPPLPVEIRSELARTFRPHIEELSRILGRDLNAFWQLEDACGADSAVGSRPELFP